LLNVCRNPSFAAAARDDIVVFVISLRKAAMTLSFVFVAFLFPLWELQAVGLVNAGLYVVYNRGMK
jgi:hypothetical protein